MLRDGRCLRCADETPTSPETAAQLERINARVRRRSSQAIETATVHASLILVALDLPRGFVEDATRALREQLDELEAERDLLKRQLRAELHRRNLER